VKPSEILSKWVGEAEKNIEDLFEQARSQPVSVIFIDEIDALAPRRSESSSPVMARLVPQILAEMEGFAGDGESALLFLGATNEPWLLDPAILRPGRFDELLYVGLPDLPARRRLLEIHLGNRPLASDVDLGELAARLDGFSGADIRRICEEAASGAFLAAVAADADHPIGRADLLRALEGSAPSVSATALERYERYGEEKSLPRPAPRGGGAGGGAAGAERLGKKRAAPLPEPPGGEG
jgi:transitional endoplasmic reticulum ATPase